MSVCVWIQGSMGVRLHASGVRVYTCWKYEYMVVYVNICLLYGSIVYGYMYLSVYEYVGVWVYESMGV